MSPFPTAVRFLLPAIASLLLGSSSLSGDAIVTPEAVPPGRYRIEGPGGEAGKVIIPAYGVMRGLENPAAGTEYRDILLGEPGARLEYADGRKVRLADAIRSGEVRLSGIQGSRNDLGVARTYSDRLRVQGPSGAELVLDSTLVVTAEAWLQSWPEYAIREAHAKRIGELLDAAPGPHDDSLERKVYEAGENGLGMRRGVFPEFERVFGEAGVKALRGLAAKGEVRSVNLSTPGLDPVARISAADEDSMISGWLALDGGTLTSQLVRLVEAKPDLGLLRKRHAAALPRLCPPKGAILLRLAHREWLFAQAGQQEVKVLTEDMDAELGGIEAVRDWLKMPEAGARTLVLAAEVSKPMQAFDDPSESTSWISSVCEALSGGGERRARLALCRDLRDVPARLASMPVAKAAKDVAVFWAPGGEFPANKASVATALTGAGVQMVSAGADIASPLVVIVGDEELPAVRESVARMALAGKFKGKAVAWLVPSRTTSREFPRFLLEQGRASSVLVVYRGLVPAVTEPFLTALATAAKDMRPGGESLQEVIGRAARVGMPGAGSARLRAYLEGIEAGQLWF